MPTILRATDQNMATASVAFNFDDMEGQAKKYPDRVRVEAGKIVVQAKQEAAAVRPKAQADGRQAAQAEAEQMIQKQLATVIPAFARRSSTSSRPSRHGWPSGKGPPCTWRRRSPSG